MTENAHHFVGVSVYNTGEMGMDKGGEKYPEYSLDFIFASCNMSPLSMGFELKKS
jgi:hypothetical protein